jgi:hypothetical protein
LSTQRRFILLDPSLRDRRGHHYSLGCQLSAAARAADMEPVWLCHAQLSRDLAPANVHAIPIFSTSLYDQKHARDDPQGKRAAESWAGSVRSVLQELCVAEHDLVLLHTAEASAYRGIEVLLAGNEPLPCFHIATPYDLAVMPGKLPARHLLAVFFRIRGMLQKHQRVYFWAETPPLAKYLTWLTSISHLPLTLPAPEWAVDKSRWASNRIEICYLGAAREEKGFVQLASLIEAVNSDAILRARFRFNVQATPQIVGYSQPVLDALERLRTFPSDYVRLVLELQSDEDYRGMLLGSDVVALLYDREKYLIRGSMIAVEACAAGKFMLVRDGTYPAGLATVASAVGGHDNESWLRSLRSLSEQFSERTALLAREAAGFRAVHSGKAYIQRLVLRETACGRLAPTWPHRRDGLGLLARGGPVLFDHRAGLIVDSL